MNKRISEINENDRAIDLTAEVISIEDTKTVQSKYNDSVFRIAKAIIKDDSGSISLNLWNEQTDMVRVGDRVKIENGYVKTYREQLQLNSGKYGTLTVL